MQNAKKLSRAASELHDSRACSISLARREMFYRWENVLLHAPLLAETFGSPYGTFCGHAILSRTYPLVVRNALTNRHLPNGIV